AFSHFHNRVTGLRRKARSKPSILRQILLSARGLHDDIGAGPPDLGAPLRLEHPQPIGRRLRANNEVSTPASDPGGRTSQAEESGRSNAKPRKSLEHAETLFRGFGPS